MRKYNLKVDEVECTSNGLSSFILDNANCSCAVIYDKDVDFGRIEVVNCDVSSNTIQLILTDDCKLPSQNIDPSRLSHLTIDQQRSLFIVLDRYSECFSDKPGFCSILEHEIPVTVDCKPKRLPAYRVPKNLKACVNTQIRCLLQLGIIKPSKSPRVHQL